MRAVCVRCRHLNGRQLSGLNNISTAGCLLLGWEACARDKNTLARLCAKKAGGAYARGGAYLRDTTVSTLLILTVPEQSPSCVPKCTHTLTPNEYPVAMAMPPN